MLPVIAIGPVAENAEVELTYDAATDPRTVAVNTQVEFAGIVPAVKRTSVLPLAIAPNAPNPVRPWKLPPHEFVDAGVPLPVRLTGKRSLIVTPVNATLLLFVSVRVRVTFVLTNALGDENDFTTDGGVKTSSTALGPVVIPALVVDIVDVWLKNDPADAAVTATDTVQTPLATIPPPENAREEPPAMAVTTGEPQPLVITFGIAALTSPPGYGSVNARPVMAEPAFGFVTVMVIVDVPPGIIATGENAFVAVGGVRVVTFSVAVAGAPVPPFVELIFPVVLE